MPRALYRQGRSAWLSHAWSAIPFHRSPCRLASAFAMASNSAPSGEPSIQPASSSARCINSPCSASTSGQCACSSLGCQLRPFQTKPSASRVHTAATRWRSMLPMTYLFLGNHRTTNRRFAGQAYGGRRAPTRSQVLVAAVKRHNSHHRLPNSSRCRQHCPAHALANKRTSVGAARFLFAARTLSADLSTTHQLQRLYAHESCCPPTSFGQHSCSLVSRVAFLEGPEPSNMATYRAELLTKSDTSTLSASGVDCPCPWIGSAIEIDARLMDAE